MADSAAGGPRDRRHGLLGRSPSDPHTASPGLCLRLAMYRHCGMSGNSVNSVDGSVTAIATGYPSVEGQVRLSPHGSRRPGEQISPIRQFNVRGV
jgi:hypothetical protein